MTAKARYIEPLEILPRAWQIRRAGPECHDRTAACRRVSARKPRAVARVGGKIATGNSFRPEARFHDLENGATGLAVLIAGAPSANGYGLRDASQPTLARALDNVWLDAVALRLDAGSRDLKSAEALIAVAAERQIDLAKLDIALGLD